MYRIIKPKKIIKSIIYLLLIYFIIQYLFDINISNYNGIYSIDINATIHALQQAKSRETDVENKYQLTAIILHWKRLSGTRRLIQYYLNTHLFKQIIIWNNNPEITLTIDQLLVNSTSINLIHTINFHENLKDEAKYRACARAQTPACFYADDEWDTSGYIKSLISSFQSDPNVLHSATSVSTYYNNMLWTFMDSQIDLHTGFSWNTFGSIFLREHALRHLHLLQMHFPNQQKLFAVSDLFFPIWLNDIPSQMIVNLRMLPTSPNETGNSFLPEKESDDLQQTSTILAIRKLEYSLRLNQSNTNIDFPRYQHRQFPYYVKSSSLNDDFIFYTNILPIDIEHIAFSIEKDAERATYRNIPSGSDYTHFTGHNTLQAIDGNEDTCWHPNKRIKSGDFFAIDFLRIQSNILVTFVLQHTKKLQNKLDMRLSFDGISWISYRSRKGILTSTGSVTAGGSHRLIIDSRQFPSELQSFRYISFNATHDFDEVFQVCDVQIIKSSIVIIK
ncbi:unnamed protein product [Adineta steineri]|uniref:F5/8 type C domain-containing protein n=1 Tax=Adineta steineri TaxID=433720 RepID=A0A813Z2R6_9BILA|nr:unnamed protein product [Adineta steineri]CAF0892687.1 unnamed protein product [Adineta steineri]